ncbi:sugar phosphate isomerase/epimerase family protein [Eshraghiella crossota]|jgi:sugar phosphate isomerase/epimerase|uniref:sugar phosphate isomerase/epimerase family protein n=1 Tax=Eshraghiella crossota TaxID=45851 RepID=UPI003FD83FB1
MKLSISNIGWAKENDTSVYNLMKKYGFHGLEIAPTRIFTELPYDKKEEAEEWSLDIKNEYGFSVSSMQSIWFGRQEKIFGCDEERNALLEYTKKAIDFASNIGCENLVFGCPRNRNLPDDADESVAVVFFKELGDYAYSKGTVIGMEANPPIYNTNFINDTKSALNLIEKVNSMGFRLNLDLGTIIQNDEDVSELIGKVPLINHVHISEPGLKPIEERSIHIELKTLLEKEGYNRFISIEMGKVDDIGILEEKMDYVRRIFA